MKMLKTTDVLGDFEAVHYGDRKRRSVVGKIIIYLVLSFWALSTIYPFVWVIINSFKQRGLITSDGFSLPLGDAFTLDNYKLAWERVDLLSAYKNSIIISTCVVLVVIVLAGFAGYALARYNFFGKKFVHGLVVASMMFPVFSTIIPVFKMMFSWGIVSTGELIPSMISVILPQIAGNLSFSIIVLMGFIKSIPLELEEAAYLEGCNPFQIFFKIIIPLSMPSFATVAIFTFLWSYNDLFTQMFFLRYRTTFTITRLLNEISSIAGTNYGLLCAAVVIVVVPVLIVYVIMQKYIIKGLTAGAIKG